MRPGPCGGFILASPQPDTTGEEEGTSGVLTFLIGYMIAFFIYIAITLYGVGVIQNNGVSPNGYNSL